MLLLDLWGKVNPPPVKLRTVKKTFLPFVVRFVVKYR